MKIVLQGMIAQTILTSLLLLPFLCSATADNRIRLPSTTTSNGSHGGIHDEVASVIAENIVQGHELPISLRRNLGDFDELNDLFNGMVLGLPDLYIADTKILGATVQIWVTNLKCGSMMVDDIVMTYGMQSNTRFDLGVDIQGLDISCTLDWRYKWSFMSGSGKGQVYTDNNNAQTSIRFYSQGYDQHPPSGTSVDSCNSFIDITDMDFQGGIVGSILNTFEKSMRGAVEKAIQNTACDELGSLGTTLVADMLDYVYDLLESYLVELPPGYTDILSAENQLTVPEGTQLINFTDFGSTLGTDTMGTLFQSGLSFLDRSLGTMVPDPDSGGSGDGYDLGVNRLLRSTVLNEEGAFAINVTDLPDYAATSGVIFQGHDMLTETVITLDEVKLFGLDSFERFDPLNAAGQYTLGNSFFWEHLRAEFSLTLVMKPSTTSDSLIAVGTDAEVRESITVSVEINDIDVDFYFLFGIEENELGKLQLGSMLDTSMILPCLLPSIYANEVTGFSASIGEMELLKLEGFISPGIDRIVSKAAEAVYIMYESTLLKAMPNFFELTVRNITNEAISNIIDGVQGNSSCTRHEEIPQDRVLNFGDLLLSKEDAILMGGSGEEPYGTMVRDMVSLLLEEIQAVNPQTNNLYMNEVVVRNITSQLSGVPGTIEFPSDLFSTKSKFTIGELTAALEVKLSDAQIDNIDSFGLPLQLLEPTGGSVLNNIFMIGAGDKPLRATSQLTVAFSDEKDIQLRNVIDLGLEISNTTVQVEALISILESRLLQFPIEDINNFDCWLSMIPAPSLDAKGVRKENFDPTLALQQLKIVVESIRLQIDCVECSSPKFQDMADILASDEAIEDVTRLANSAIDYISGLLGGTFLQVKLDRILADAAKRCPHRPEFVSVDASQTQYLQFDDATTSQSSIGLILALGSVIGVAFVILAISRMIVVVVRNRRHSKWFATLSNAEVLHYKKEQLKESERQTLVDRETLPMFRSLVIPTYIRFGVPLVIIANIGFFLSGHLSLGASVDIDAQIGGEAIRIKEIFVFSMADSVLDMWEAGAKELAILILLLSGVWPYTKQLIVMFLWFAPTKITSVRRRESLLLWLDALGKWSFVDIFVLIMSVPSFRVAISSPDNTSFLPDEIYSLNLLVIPCWGLYSNMIAQLISQFNSHLIIHYHRKIVFDFEARESCFSEEVEEDTVERRKLCDHMFERDGAKKGHPIVLRKGVSKGLIILAIVFVALIVTGVIMPSFSLSQFGLVGLAVETSPGQSSYNMFNVFSTIQLLMNQARFTGVASDYIGLGALSAIFIITVIIVPVLQLALLLLRWFGNLDKKARLRIFVAVEALQAWQYVEVYIFSIVIACWQLGSVSEFLINDYCGPFDSLFNSLAYFGILSPMDSQCFKVQADVQPGAWILVAASVTLLLLNHVISSAAKQQERDIENKNGDVLIECGHDDDDDDEALEGVRLKPRPPSFSDNYRWLLSRNGELLLSLSQNTQVGLSTSGE